MPTLSYKYRIEPNRTQSAALADMLADFCQLYNAGLEQRIDARRRRHVSVNYGMQASELKAVRCAAPQLARWSFSAEQQVLRRLDKTFKAFFRRGKGFPRLRAVSRYHAAEFRVGDGLTIRKGGRLGFVGVAGDIKKCAGIGRCPASRPRRSSRGRPASGTSSFTSRRSPSSGPVRTALE